MFRQFGWPEILIILLIALLIFGPSKLPQLGKSIGKTIREFRRNMSGTTDDEEDEEEEDEGEEEERH
jgi:sec-independent protein translocase protein TatA